ncbi:MAG: HD domain-containing protein [Treponema sp.]|nr:HD domain-containing protein [Treponema sp.]
MKIDPILKEIASIFNTNGKEIYLVGGAVRDMLMGKKIHDWDLASSALPGEVAAIVRKAGGKVIPTGIKHGTVTVIYKKHSAEVTTFRTESDYTDGRRPDSVSYAATIQEDLSRRDFTMNAIALGLPAGKIVDPFGGEADSKAKIIRCVGNANERFSEDGLRPLRAVRFAAQLGFTIDNNTLNAISGVLPVCAKVSWERVRDEINKILASNQPSIAFRLMEQTGLLELFLGELSACRNIEQKGFHEFDVLDHSLLACDYAAAKNYSHELRLAALLHDIGKPSVREMGKEGVWTFYRHEEKSEIMARKLLRRLRYSNAIIEKTCHLIKEHMFIYTPDWSNSAVRRFIARVGESYLDDIYKLRHADVFGFAGKEQNHNYKTQNCSLLQLIDRVDKAILQDQAFTIKDLAVNGSDLIKIGIPAGKTLGIILKELLETVLDDPKQNTRETLLKIAQGYSEKLYH